MRISLALTVAIATPVLLLTACTAEPAEPVRGTVIDKEHEPAKHGKKRVPITKRQCTSKYSAVKKKTEESCKNVITGHKTVKYLRRAECYELDIRTKDGGVTEICDEAAYMVLNVGDRYSSDVNYTRDHRVTSLRR